MGVFRKAVGDRWPLIFSGVLLITAVGMCGGLFLFAPLINSPIQTSRADTIVQEQRTSTTFDARTCAIVRARIQTLHTPTGHHFVESAMIGEVRTAWGARMHTSTRYEMTSLLLESAWVDRTVAIVGPNERVRPNQRNRILLSEEVAFKMPAVICS